MDDEQFFAAEDTTMAGQTYVRQRTDDPHYGPYTADVIESPDMVNHPPHYTSHPSGVECITITRHMGFNLGNALKYVWRADLKGSSIEDLEKAKWYIQDEIDRRKQ
jgi:hypothetical protein